jgi:hypothetical protein
VTFSATSRYFSIDTATYVAADGTMISYLRRRFLPAPDLFTVLQVYQVAQGDRLDNITARFLGDPEQFWRICDANAVLRPQELEQIGTKIRITLPVGIPGTPNA